MNYFSSSYIKEKWGDAGFQKYFTSTGWSFLSRMLSMVVSFLATVFIARNLGPENYGQLSYAVSFVGLFAFIATFGVDTILYRELIKHPENSQKLLGTGFGIRIIAGTIAAAICGITALLVVENDVSKILIFLLTTTFALNSFQVINHEFQAQVRSKYPSIVTITVTTILNILKIITILLGEGVIYLSLILVLESVLYAVFYLYIYEKKLGGNIFSWTFEWAIAKTLLKDSWPLMFSTAFALIYARIDQVFIKHMIDVSSVGVYDAAVRLAEVWYIIPSILVTALFPAIINAKKTSEELYFARIKKLGLLLLVLALLISLPVTLLAPYLMTILYGKAFIAGVIVLQIYVWATVGIFLGSLVTNYLIAENHRRIVLFTSLVPMVINVSLNLLWIPVYGITGAAFATLVSYMLMPFSIILFSQTRKAFFNICRT